MLQPVANSGSVKWTIVDRDENATQRQESREEQCYSAANFYVFYNYNYNPIISPFLVSAKSVTILGWVCV